MGTLLLSVVIHNPPRCWEEHGGNHFRVLQYVNDAALECLADGGLQVTHPGETVLPELVHDEAGSLWKSLDRHMQIASLAGCGICVDLQSLLELLCVFVLHRHLSLHQQDVRVIRSG